ncbi:MAG: hypothetical protein JW944_07215 [Deltaproteobacteria bacterium]|nr:hypothetical protein [Deltaproteobacteria bacterium]
MSPLKEKILTSILCVLGVAGIVYGMMEKNNPVFIIGILFVIAGYVMIRRKLKQPIDNK